MHTTLLPTYIQTATTIRIGRLLQRPINRCPSKALPVRQQHGPIYHAPSFHFRAHDISSQRQQRNVPRKIRRNGDGLNAATSAYTNPLWTRKSWAANRRKTSHNLYQPQLRSRRRQQSNERQNFHDTRQPRIRDKSRLQRNFSAHPSPSSHLTRNSR
jgi:hypothetical protein